MLTAAMNERLTRVGPGTPGGELMRRYWIPIAPYAQLDDNPVRKVRVLIAEKNIACEFVEENAWAADTKVPQFNPLNKVPALVLDDGESIYDSGVIAEYLDTLPGASFIPKDARSRALVRRDEALGDGISDAGITMRLEGQREAARQDAAWIARQRSKVEAGIAAVSKSVSSRRGAPRGP